MLFAKKNHPNHGGSHEKMLVITATKDYLEGVLNGAKGYGPEWGRQKDWTDSSSYSNPKEPPKQERPKPKTDGEPFKPKNIMRYAVGWWIIINVKCVRETERAILVEAPDEDEPFWLPKSQLHQNANQVWETFDEGDIVFSEWIARQKGWV